MILSALKKFSLTGSLVLFLLTGVAYGQLVNPQPIFDQANQHLQKGEVPQALKGYHQLENKNQISGALFLNMGLSYIRLDSMGRAKYYFLKAQQFEETRDQAQQGLSYVENHFSRESAVLPTLPWQRALNWLNDYIGATLLLAAGVILLNIGVFLYIIPWFTQRQFTGMRPLTATIATVGIIIMLLGFFINYRQHRYHKAVMVHQKTTVREQPNATATMISQAFEGYTFRVDLNKSSHAGWNYVRMSNGQYGWIPSKEIMIL